MQMFGQDVSLSICIRSGGGMSTAAALNATGSDAFNLSFWTKTVRLFLNFCYRFISHRINRFISYSEVWWEFTRCVYQ